MSFTARINSFVARKLYKLLNAFANQDSKNISRNRRRLASMDTAAFVDEHLFDVPVFDDRFALIRHALKAVKVEGQYLEFGVYQGKTVNLIASERLGVPVFGFDSFEGLPEDWRHDYKKGAFTLEKLPEVKVNVTLVKGWFNETLPGFVREHPQPCAFIHIDCDLYSSTKTVFDTLGTQIVRGTVIVFDEYFNYPGWRQGEFKALAEMCARSGFGIEYLGYCDKDEQVAVRLR